MIPTTSDLVNLAEDRWKKYSYFIVGTSILIIVFLVYMWLRSHESAAVEKYKYEQLKKSVTIGMKMHQDSMKLYHKRRAADSTLLVRLATARSGLIGENDRINRRLRSTKDSLRTMSYEELASRIQSAVNRR